MREHQTTEGCILIQGPMPIEAERLAARLESVEREETGNFIFYIGSLAGHTVVAAKTSKGMENAAAATAVGIERYRPAAVINQGTAGGHDPALQVGDIVLGARVTNLGNLKTADRPAGAGSLLFQQRVAAAVRLNDRRVCELVLQRSADIGKILLPQCVLFRLFRRGQSLRFCLAGQFVDARDLFFFHRFPGSFPWMFLFAVYLPSIASFGAF